MTSTPTDLTSTLRALCALLLLIPALVACDGSTPNAPTATPPVVGAAPSPTPETETTATALPDSDPGALPTPSGTVIDAAPATPPATPDESAPSPTAVTSEATGSELTALQALERLREEALAWQRDARFGMLANTRPGQAKSLLAGALGDPDVNEPTPRGLGRNWTLVAFSPAAGGALAFSVDGTAVDLVKEGAVTDEMLAGFGGPGNAPLDLSTLDISTLTDSDEIFQQAGQIASEEGAGIALLAPDGLGIGPLPTPPSGGEPPKLAYELFSSAADKQLFIFYDARTGQVVLDSTSP